MTRKDIKVAVRVALMFALLGAGVFLLFSSPLDESETWVRDFMYSKACAVALLGWFRHLYRRGGWQGRPG